MGLRVVLVNDLLPPDHEGGLELSAFEIGKALIEMGHSVDFVCCKWRDSYSGDRSEPPYMHRIFNYAEVRARTESKLPRKLESFRAVERRINIAAGNYRLLTEFLEKNGPFDVALVFGVLFIGLGTVRAFTDKGISVVWSVGDVAIPVHFSMPGQTRLYSLTFRTIGKKWHEIEKTVDFSRMMFVSEFSRREMLKSGFKPRQSAVVPRAVNFEPGNPAANLKEQPPLIFAACRLAPARGPHVAVEAAKLLLQRRPDLSWKLVIAGGGERDYTKELHQAANPLGERIEFLGKIPKDQVIARMRRTTIFVNPTVEVEGFGRTNIEALANGVALVTSDIPSVHEIVDANGCAILFPPGDAHALSVHLERLLEAPEERAELADRGIARVRDKYMMKDLMMEVERELRRAARSEHYSSSEFSKRPA